LDRLGERVERRPLTTVESKGMRFVVTTGPFDKVTEYTHKYAKETKGKVYSLPYL